jgi:hypothetical protein
MSVPPLSPDTLFAELLQDLPSELVAMAYEFKAFARSRKLKTPRHLMRVVLLYCGVDQTLREVAGTMTLLSTEQITDTAIAARLAACRPWVKALLAHMLKFTSLDHVPADKRLLVVDASHVSGPGATGSQYRIHVSMNLLTLEFVEILVTDYKTGETLANFVLGAGDVVVADRGYAQRAAIVTSTERGAHVVVRYSPQQFPVSDEQGRTIDFVRVLQDQPECSLRTLAVQITPASGKTLSASVHAYRLSEKDAAEARRKVRRARRKSKHGAKPETLFLAGWVLVLTTLSAEEMSAETILALYRVRWQIEVAIKRWKSVLDVAQLRARWKSPLAEVWLAGKMLYALLVERRGRRIRGAPHWERLDRERKQTWWRMWKLVRADMAQIISGSMFWEEERWSECLEVLAERRRQRKLQRLPAAVIEYLQASTEKTSNELRAAA